jgi:hypothetical protein
VLRDSVGKQQTKSFAGSNTLTVAAAPKRTIED